MHVLFVFVRRKQRERAECDETRFFRPALLSRHYFVPCAGPRLFPPQFNEYSRALTALILPSIPACYPDVALDSPHCREPIKTCKNIWEVWLPGMQLAIVASQQRNKRAVRGFDEGQPENVLNHSSMGR